MNTIKPATNAMLAMLFLMVGIPGLSYNTPLTLYQGQSVKFQRERLRGRLSLCDYWYVKSIIHNPNLVRSK